MTATLSRTALLVAVPAAEPVVGRHRRVLDHTAGWGIPAHVTVLYPFVPPDQVDAAVLAAVQEAVAAVAPFDCSFSRVEWFADQVVWLAPDDDRPFRALTGAVFERFPACPPYRGAIPDPTPHLTVGDTRLADLAAMQQAATEVQEELPVTARIDRVTLMAGTDEAGSWRTVAEFPVGRA
jgi:2'-5' RNA ligase